MKTKLVGLLLFTAGLLMPAAAQDRVAGSDPLATGIRQVDEGDLEGAVQTLGIAVKQLATDKQRSRDLALAHVYLAMAHLGLGNPAAAKQSMIEALSADRNLKLDAKRFPPRVRQLQEDAKLDMKQGAKAPPLAPAQTAAAAMPPPTTPPPATAPAATPQRPVATALGPSLAVSIGARVRVAAPATGDQTVVGTLVRSDSETIVVERETTREGVTIPAASLTRLDVSKGKGGRRSVVFGVLGGLLVGGGAGALYGNVNPADSCCGTRGVAKWAAIGGGGGMLIGGVIGKTLGGEHWETVHRKQVWIAPLGSRGLQIALLF